MKKELLELAIELMDKEPEKAKHILETLMAIEENEQIQYTPYIPYPVYPYPFPIYPIRTCGTTTKSITYD